MMKMCILDEKKVCDDCGRCDYCEFDESKICDNCMKCVTGDATETSVLIDKIIMPTTQHKVFKKK